jgi:hypothetical protein
MKKHMTLALAVSMLFLTMAAAPHRAMAASDTYLYIDGVNSEDSGGSQTAPAQHSCVICTILSFFGL